VLGEIETSLGTFGAAFSPVGLGRLTFPREPFDGCEAWARRWLPGAKIIHDGRWLTALSEQLVAYFAGALREFTVPVDLRGTAFQLRVWTALRDIGYGEVRSYADLAAAIGSPSAVRAVGLANGANPVPIVVPCHRVVGRNGTLTGYGGGLMLKARLLQLEGAPGFSSPAHQEQLPLL
jgi:methylated-DNA-[protein]-cysteine S-methyltransferase